MTAPIDLRPEQQDDYDYKHKLIALCIVIVILIFVAFIQLTDIYHGKCVCIGRYWKHCYNCGNYSNYSN